MLTSFNLKDIKVLHVEPTTVCQAACPQCDREDPDLYSDELNRNELTLEKIQNILPESVVKNLDKIFMCGTFGDPAACKETIGIYRWFRQVNPEITLGMNTNGGLRQPLWWKELGELFNKPYDYVVFSIDGLEDTNHIYRRNVSWKKVIENASAFISTGASAHWDMLIFDYNKHQIDKAEETARDLGFNWFKCKISKRFFNKPVEGLNPPDNIELPNIVDPDKIICYALSERSMYLASTGELLPCCWMGSRVFNRDIQVDAAVNTTNFQGVIHSWETEPLPVCKRNCGIKENSSSSFERQWFRQVLIK